MEIQLPRFPASGLQNGDVLSGSINSATYTDHDSVSYLNVKYTGSHSDDDIQVQSYSITENLSDLGYDVTNDDTITVSPRVVTLEAVKIYDGTDNLVGNEVTIGNLVGNETINHTNTTVYNKHVEAVGEFTLHR